MGRDKESFRRKARIAKNREILADRNGDMFAEEAKQIDISNDGFIYCQILHGGIVKPELSMLAIPTRDQLGIFANCELPVPEPEVVSEEKIEDFILKLNTQTEEFEIMATTSTRVMGEFQPKRLTQARLAKKNAVSELAVRLDITRQAISSFENGTSKPSVKTLRELCKQLDAAELYFFTPLRVSEQSRESAINYRTLRSSKKKSRAQAGVYLEWLASTHDFASSYVSLPPVNLPTFEVDDFKNLSGSDIEKIAEDTRRFLDLGDGPITNLCKLLENNGVSIAYLPLDESMDGLSAWFNGRPVTVINRNAYHARSRFDLAHELFHLIAHRSVTKEELDDKEILNIVESQAHRFAGAFLAPYKTFLKEVYSVDYDSLIELKKRWGISAQAIVMRLNDLQIMTDSQKIRFFTKLNIDGQKRKEKLDGEIEPERAELLKRIAEFLNENRVLYLNEFLSRIGIPEWFVEMASGIKKQEDTEIPDNLVAFEPFLKKVN